MVKKALGRTQMCSAFFIGMEDTIMNQKNSSIVSIWNAERINYQRRYANMIIRDDENPNDQNNKGAINEAGYVLINIFGLTPKQVREVERNQGFTNEDLDID